MPSGNLIQYSKLGRPTVIVDGQEFTERGILLHYGTPADRQNPEGLALLSSFLTGSFHACPCWPAAYFRLLTKIKLSISSRN